MTRMRSLITIVLFLFPLSLFAQSSDLGLWISHSTFDSTELVDEGDVLEFEFDEDMGYGVTWTQYWGNALALELGAQKLGGDLAVSVDDFSIDVGEIDLTALTGTLQFHLLRGSRFSPYIGGGAAYVMGDAELGDDDDPLTEDSVDFENEITWLANGGVTINISDRFAIGGDLKYIAYEAVGEDDEEDEGLDINPLIFSVGVRLRFGR